MAKGIGNMKRSRMNKWMLEIKGCVIYQFYNLMVCYIKTLNLLSKVSEAYPNSRPGYFYCLSISPLFSYAVSHLVQNILGEEYIKEAALVKRGLCLLIQL